MICSLNDLKCKEVINVETGEKIGFIDDIEFEPENGTVIAFIIYGRMRFWRSDFRNGTYWTGSRGIYKKGTMYAQRRQDKINDRTGTV